MSYSSRLFFVAQFLIAVSVSAQDTIKLFNQKNLEGWYAYEPQSGRHTNASELFHVENHIIRMYGDKAGYLMSEQSFSNFKLTVEFRWNNDTTYIRKNNLKNSGVMYLIPAQDSDRLWPRGIQFQIKEGSTGDFILLQGFTICVNGTRTEPGNTVIVKRMLDAINPNGEWNSLVVTCNNGTIKQELNEKLVNEASEPSVSEGRILLQYEGFPIDFRKVEIITF
jgi:hypothetical protein